MGQRGGGDGPPVRVAGQRPALPSNPPTAGGMPGGRVLPAQVQELQVPFTGDDVVDDLLGL